MYMIDQSTIHMRTICASFFKRENIRAINPKRMNFNCARTYELVQPSSYKPPIMGAVKASFIGSSRTFDVEMISDGGRIDALQFLLKAAPQARPKAVRCHFAI